MCRQRAARNRLGYGQSKGHHAGDETSRLTSGTNGFNSNTASGPVLEAADVRRMKPTHEGGGGAIKERVTSDGPKSKGPEENHPLRGNSRDEKNDMEAGGLVRKPAHFHGKVKSAWEDSTTTTKERLLSDEDCDVSASASGTSIPRTKDPHAVSPFDGNRNQHNAKGKSRKRDDF